ncbi:mitochondrial sodium/calcium exchanger protein-like [Glandiceps talaboti]
MITFQQCCRPLVVLFWSIPVLITVESKPLTVADNNTNVQSPYFPSVFQIRKLVSREVNDQPPLDFSSTDVESLHCIDALDELNYTERCQYITVHPNCQNEDGFVNYLKITHCLFPDDEKLFYVSLIPLFLWLLYMFLALGFVAEKFFCPLLEVISKTLRLDENVAGVTFLAFGNGAPDVFSAIAAVKSGNGSGHGVKLMVAGLFGSGIFITTVIVFAVVMVKSFRIDTQIEFMRDVIVYLGACFWTYYVILDGGISMGEALGFIGLYIGYVIIVVITPHLSKCICCRRGRTYTLADSENPQDEDNRSGERDLLYPPESNVPTTYGSVPTHEDSSQDHDSCHGANYTEDSGEGGVEEEEVREQEQEQDKEDSGNDSGVGHNGDDISEGDGEGEKLEEEDIEDDEDDMGIVVQPGSIPAKQIAPNQVTAFFIKIFPIDLTGWKQMMWYSRIYEIIKSPVQFAVTLTTPLVDYNKDRNNWNRLLNSLHFLTAPIFCIFALKVAMMSVHEDFLAWQLTLCFGSIFCVLTFITSRHWKPPIYHAAFAYFGFVVCVIWIYCIANELINTLETIGVIFDISDEILGLLLLAMGNSFPDLITNRTNAKAGYSVMSMSACFGGPLLNMLLGFGLSCTLGTVRAGADLTLRHGPMQVLLFSTISLSLFSTLFILTCMRFRVTRPYGVYLVFIYACFIALALFIETGVIKAWD